MAGQSGILYHCGVHWRIQMLKKRVPAQHANPYMRERWASRRKLQPIAPNYSPIRSALFDRPYRLHIFMTKDHRNRKISAIIPVLAFAMHITLYKKAARLRRAAAYRVEPAKLTRIFGAVIPSPPLTVASMIACSSRNSPNSRPSKTERYVHNPRWLATLANSTVKHLHCVVTVLHELFRAYIIVPSSCSQTAVTTESLVQW